MPLVLEGQGTQKSKPLPGPAAGAHQRWYNIDVPVVTLHAALSLNSEMSTRVFCLFCSI